IQPRPSLVPFRVREKWIRRLSGISFSEAKLTVFHNEKKMISKKGKLLFTHFGLSGPLALNMSKYIGDLLQKGEIVVSVDSMPRHTLFDVDDMIQKLFETQKNKKIKNILSGFLVPLLIPTFLEISSIDPEKPVHSITRAERKALVGCIKDLRMTVEGLLDEKKAIVTSGGVDLCEVDFTHMRSRLYENLYLVGDVLNIDRPSGGYSLQLCWTTGFVAGSSVADFLEKQVKDQ
ncbi:MAG: aminoacetone oxidase family FAD-binding enzyme, partial [Candidatus Moranbacteria bacterium]|nr:aminoacetone oxidase family FAD-binding enzyme [Candidatus Moranbacteria bacterium]